MIIEGFVEQIHSFRWLKKLCQFSWSIEVILGSLSFLKNLFMLFMKYIMRQCALGK